MKFFSDLFRGSSAKISKLEKEASDSFELPNDSKALRVNGSIYIISSNKITSQFLDVFPSNPARATFQIMKKLGLTDYDGYKETLNKKIEKQTITCNFRDDEDRWVWYENSKPRMTLSFQEAFPNIDRANLDFIDKKIDFCSAKYGTLVIDKIKKEGFKKTSEELNALILENPYTTIKCGQCEVEENYTIDDLCNESKKAQYDSNFVICFNCNKLIKLT
jgi:hypothetical protein